MGTLVLTRKKEEAVVMYKKTGEILCKIVKIGTGPKQVKLAFEAESDLKIDREEVYKG